jgi:hypothetical protein
MVVMAESTPTHDEWHKLYQAAMRLKETAPWKWMAETDLFGVQNPETDELGFVSVMGALGEHLSIGVYLGAEGLYSFWGFQQIGASAPPEAILGMLHLQASFEDRNELTKKDRDVIKSLGLKFRGRQAWPLFRSYRPGFFPWYLEGWEARFLTLALEQTVEVALRFKENRAMLDTAADDSYLVRVPREAKGTLVWEDRVVVVPPVDPEPISISMDVDALKAVNRLPRRRYALEIDFFMVPILVGERGTRPSYPHMLLVVERESGMVLGSELLTPEPSLEAMWGLVPVTLVYKFANIGIVPTQVRVQSPLLAKLLQLLAEELGFEVKLTPSLRSLEHAKDFLMQRFV